MTVEPMRPGRAAAGYPRPAGGADENLRERLGEFRALLVISLLMTESVSEDQILDLAASSAPGLGPWRIDGYSFTGGLWRPGIGRAVSSPAGLAARLTALGSGAGPVELPGRGLGVPAARSRRPARPPDRLLRPGTVRPGAVRHPGDRAAGRRRGVERAAARQGVRHGGGTGRGQRRAGPDRGQPAAHHGHP